MQTEAPASTVESTEPETIAELLPAAVAAHSSRRAVSYKGAGGQWRSKTFTEVGEEVRKLALGLIDLGITKGDRVSILGNTRPEWTYFDFAALTIGAVVVPIYQTNSPEECRHVLTDAEAIAVIVEDDEQLDKVRAIHGDCPDLVHVIRMTGSGGGAITAAELAERGAGRDQSEWEVIRQAITPDDLCTVIYTSGTTGAPKGCMISHRNYRAMLEMVKEVRLLEDSDAVTYLFLPLAHSFALLIQLVILEMGGTLAYWERDPTKIIDNVGELRPENFPSVPRIFEKVHAAAMSGAAEASGIKKGIFEWALAVGADWQTAVREGRPGPVLRLKHALADRLVLAKIRDVFGGNIQVAVSGAAPINPEILRFFDAAGILVLEGWGMTETSTASTICLPGAFRFGTVGRAFPGVELTIASDGEILVRGANVFQGYYGDQAATDEVLIDGWLHTGDVGELDDEGFLAITGRKKDIIITAGGKNITPSNIEAEVRNHPLVSECVLIGDRRPYLVALITLDAEEAVKFARGRELPSDPVVLAGEERIREAIQEHVDAVNSQFSRVEQIKRFTILERDFTIDGGQLTPSLKVKRNVVSDQYASEADALYL